MPERRFPPPSARPAFAIQPHCDCRPRPLSFCTALSSNQSIQAEIWVLIVGADFGVIELNEQALARLRAPKALEIILSASQLFPEPGALKVAIDHAAAWFERHLRPARGERTRTAKA